MSLILMDTNVVLDVLLQRNPWSRTVSRIWAAADAGLLRMCITGTTITDIYYVARRAHSVDLASRAVRICLQAFEVLSLDANRLEAALALPGPDYEDNLQIVCARERAVRAIVTRDADGFEASPIPVWTPQECCQQLNL